jgi:hypothetical protein
LNPHRTIHSKSVSTNGSLWRTHFGSSLAHASGAAVNFSCRLSPCHFAGASVAGPQQPNAAAAASPTRVRRQSDAPIFTWATWLL